MQKKLMNLQHWWIEKTSLIQAFFKNKQQRPCRQGDIFLLRLESISVEKLINIVQYYSSTSNPSFFGNFQCSYRCPNNQ